MGVMMCLKVGLKESERRFAKESFSDVLNMQHNKLNRPTNHQSGYVGSQESTSSKSKRPIIADLTIVVMERWRETHLERHIDKQTKKKKKNLKKKEKMERRLERLK